MALSQSDPLDRATTITALLVALFSLVLILRAHRALQVEGARLAETEREMAEIAALTERHAHILDALTS